MRKTGRLTGVAGQLCWMVFAVGGVVFTATGASALPIVTQIQDISLRNDVFIQTTAGAVFGVPIAEERKTVTQVKSTGLNFRPFDPTLGTLDQVIWRTLGQVESEVSSGSACFQVFGVACQSQSFTQTLARVDFFIDDTATDGTSLLASSASRAEANGTGVVGCFILGNCGAQDSGVTEIDRTIVRTDPSVLASYLGDRVATGLRLTGDTTSGSRCRFNIGLLSQCEGRGRADYSTSLRLSLEYQYTPATVVSAPSTIWLLGIALLVVGLGACRVEGHTLRKLFSNT